jgi:hypothetical protein
MLRSKNRPIKTFSKVHVTLFPVQSGKQEFGSIHQKNKAARFKSKKA